MHEFSIVESLVEQIETQARTEGATKVVSLSFRLGSTFSTEALHQAFACYSTGTLLEGAQLHVEEHEHIFRCEGCGYSQSVTHDDLDGHAFTCPQCSKTSLVDEAHDLELLEVRVD